MTKVYVVRENGCSECGTGDVLFVLSEKNEELVKKLDRGEITIQPHGCFVTSHELDIIPSYILMTTKDKEVI